MQKEILLPSAVAVILLILNSCSKSKVQDEGQYNFQRAMIMKSPGSIPGKVVNGYKVNKSMARAKTGLCRKAP